MLRALILTALIFIISPLGASAQFGGAVGAPAFLSVSPTNPAPEQSVTATFESYSTDLNAADISWFVNERLEKRGKGIKTFTFQMGAAGKQTSLKVVARTIEGETLEKRLSFNPAEVELFFEAETYTPPFYKGKALYTYQSDIRVIALPHFVGTNGVKISPSNLIYTWKKDGVVLQDASGFGKQVITVGGGVIIRPITIDVTVSTPEGAIRGTARQTFTSAGVRIVAYEESPLYGVRFGKAIQNNFELSQDEITLTAIPYFFSIESSDSLKYSWLMNNQTAGESSDSITFRNETGKSGSSRVSLKGENFFKLLQFASNTFIVNFSGTESENSFFRQQ